jgi:fimbrial chaperone protein
VLTLRNDGDKPLRAQVRVFSWAQAGQDKLEPTQAIVASPPMIEIAPNGTQTIRLVRGSKAAATHEESFRVLVDEIVDPAAAPENGVNVQLRYSVPVFVSPAGMRPPKMTVTASLDGQNFLLKARNEGGQHANISAVQLQTEGGDTVMLEPGLLGYVLVGKSMEWKLALPANAPKGPFVSMRCRFNGEDFSTKL